MEIGNTDSMMPNVMYASLSRRFGALVIDGLILSVIGAIGMHLIPFLGSLAVWFFYAPIFEASALRATLGKHLMGIQVADLAGRRISFRASLIRNLMKIVSAVILFIGFIFALFSSRKQTLHDLLADTTVIYGRSEIAIADAWVDETKSLFRAGEAAVSSSSGGGSIAEQLERLQALRDRGSITAEEFEAAKKKILS